jgi:hypothetical protein
VCWRFNIVSYAAGCHDPGSDVDPLLLSSIVQRIKSKELAGPSSSLLYDTPFSWDLHGLTKPSSSVFRENLLLDSCWH